MQPPSTGPAKRPLLDENEFQQLLAAAYALQGHNDRLLAKEPAKTQKADPAQVLAEIVEVQNRIQTGDIDFAQAVALIAQRIQRITRAGGVAIAVLEGDNLIYRAGTGIAASEIGTRCPLEASLSVECIRSGQWLEASDVDQDPRFPPELCHKKAVRAVACIPIYHEQKIRAVLELRSSEPRGFAEHELRTCQLMAGLVAEAMAKATEAEWKKALAAERATMLGALEKLKPELEKLVAQPPRSSTPTNSHAPTEASRSAASSPLNPPPRSETKQEAAEECRGCGHPFEGGESFCGICGTARRPGNSGDLQSKWASLWHLQEGAEYKKSLDEAEEAPLELESLPPDMPLGPAELPPALQEIIARFDEEESAATQRTAPAPPRVAPPTPPRAAPTPVPPAPPAPPHAAASVPPPPIEDMKPPLTLEAETDVDFAAGADVGTELTVVSPAVPALLEAGASTGEAIHPVASREIAERSPGHAYPWTSARKARAWLDSLHSQRRTQWIAAQWKVHRGNVYLGAAILLLLAALFGWGSYPAASNAAANSARHRRNPPKPELTFFETVLVDLGLAVPPPTPVYLGNPDVQVWIDPHTALYYCPGADLYGKTPDGKTVSQRDAQMDQFEPAFRKACE